MKLPLQPERDFQQQVVRVARMTNWRLYHTYDSRRSAHGFPDLVLCRPPVIHMWELKREDKSPTEKQQEWLDDLSQSQIQTVECMRPSDWDKIQSLLI